METMKNWTVMPSTTTPIQGTAMPMRGCAFGVESGPIESGLSVFAPVAGSAMGRTRQDAVKGHVGLVAYIPGDTAWSPPVS